MYGLPDNAILGTLQIVANKLTRIKGGHQQTQSYMDYLMRNDGPERAVLPFRTEEEKFEVAQSRQAFYDKNGCWPPATQ